MQCGASRRAGRRSTPRWFASSSRGAGRSRQLSQREREVLELMAQGRSNAGIAAELVITESAVEKHVRSVFQKLRLPQSDAENRRVLAVLAFLRAEG